MRRREGRYLLRTNRDGYDPVILWTFYIQLTEVEQAFKEQKTTLRYDRSIISVSIALKHIFVAFLSHCLQVTLKQQLKLRAPGLTPRAALETFKTIQMVDVPYPHDRRPLTALVARPIT